jgi:hypothetical protein
MHRVSEGRIVIEKLSFPTKTITLVSKKIVLPNLCQYCSALLIRREWDALSVVEVEALDVCIVQTASLEQDSQETSTVSPADMIRSFRNVRSDFYRLMPPVSIKDVSILSDELELKLKALEIEGDLTAMTIRSLNLYSPLVKASLSNPVTICLEDEIKVLSPVDNAELTALIDLSQQSLINAEGEMKAHFRIPVDRRFTDSVLYFEVTGDTLAYADRQVKSFQATGFLKDSVITLESASIQPDLEKDTFIVFNGRIDPSAQALELDYEIKLSGECLHAFFGMPFFSDQLWVKGNADGPWLSPKLDFEVLDAMLAIPELNMIRLQGAGSIKNLNSLEWNGLVESEGACLSSDIMGTIGAEAVHLEIVSLALYDPQFPEFTLSEPFSIDFDLTKDRILDRLSVSAFELSGVEQKLSGTYSPEAGLSLDISHFSSVQLNRWLCKPLPSYELESLTARITEFDPFLRGELEVNLLELDLENSFSDKDLPRIDSIKLQVSAHPEYLEIASVQVLSNQSELKGSMMLPADCLKDWLHSDVPEAKDLSKLLTGELNLNNWKMENWVEWMPAGLFRRSGSLNGSLKISEGFDLSGFIEFQDFALRPTESLSPVDQISGQLLLANQRLELQSTRARIGGSDLEATGWIDFRDNKDVLWDIKLFGKNIPLLRTTDMILRSDVNLEALHLEPGNEPLVQGRLDLKASTLLIEFDPLAVSPEAEPGLRPPFFTIDQEPINDWLFDITIFGESFMRVRSPYFKTQLSVDFHLGGSFEKPEWVGSVRTINGQLLFPGMKMQIDEGEAFIVPAEPNTIRLNFTGTAQSASHVVTMEVSNTIDEPYIQFHSTPELSNTAIARLLATGTTNETGAAAVGLYLGKGFLGAGSMNETLMDRLTIDLSKKQSRSGRQTFSANFELNEDWALNGEYDQYDAYNVDLIWHLLKR